MKNRDGEVSLADLLREDYGINIPDEDRDILVRCPWHFDSGASLAVNPVRGTYKCPNCHERNGTTLTYLTTLRGLSLDSALRRQRRLPRLPPRMSRAMGAAFRRVAVEERWEAVVQLLSMPAWPAGPPIYKAILPSAAPEAHVAASQWGCRADWNARVLLLAPTAMRALARENGVEIDITRLLHALGLETRKRVPFKQGSHGRRRLMAFVVPFAALPGFNAATEGRSRAGSGSRAAAAT